MPGAKNSIRVLPRTASKQVAQEEQQQYEIKPCELVLVSQRQEAQEVLRANGRSGGLVVGLWNPFVGPGLQGIHVVTGGMLHVEFAAM